VAVYAVCPSWPNTYCGAYDVHAVGLASGKDVVVGRGKAFGLDRNVEIEQPGLVYVNAPRARQGPRTLVLVPLSRVLAAVS
jgi:hypothetical protein